MLSSDFFLPLPAKWAELGDVHSGKADIHILGHLTPRIRFLPQKAIMSAIGMISGNHFVSSVAAINRTAPICKASLKRREYSQIVKAGLAWTGNLIEKFRAVV